jgi:hypothetical protein
MKFLLASIKLLTYYENPSSNPLQKACSGFLIAAPVTLKVVVIQHFMGRATDSGAVLLLYVVLPLTLICILYNL